jgi:DNA-binding transcriptional ArsR family regulator
MVPLESDYILVLPKVSLGVGLEPVQNALNSLFMLANVEELSGLGEWVTQVAAALPSERLHLNRVVFIGMYHAIQPERRWSSFPAYVDDLAAQPAETLRDRLLRGSCRPHGMIGKPAPPPPADFSAALESADAYLAFLRQNFPAEAIDVAIETATYHYVVDPPRMQELIVSHLREMWRLFAPEWERVKPMLQESVGAFQQLDLNNLNAFEAGQLITGHDLRGKWEPIIAEARQIIFVPSAHIGPYLGKFMSETTLWIVFGARLPEGAWPGSSALSRSELLVRLGALTDDTRLQIMSLLSQNDELCAQDIMNRLDLSQSAASRHLRQLTATGYLVERRRAGEKCYTLNRDRIGDTFRALGQFLGRT